jgi:hypothetical protein
MNNDQIRVLFIFSNIIRAAREAAAPNSNPIANVIASQLGLDNLKKSTT